MVAQEKHKRSGGAIRPAGVRFNLDEWNSVVLLMEKTGLNISDLLKTAVLEKARRNRIPIPRDGAATPDPLEEQAS